MAEGRRCGLMPQLDIEQILVEAQHRWLRAAEICEILRNYQKFHIAPQPPYKPPSGSLFLFDRKVLRYFRKDGHNWRKKKDGKTVKEAHERLKSGSVDVLHCYYAHGEDNENFQRRSYWMLEEDLMHIVLVHYREVKGNKSSLNCSRETDGKFQVAQVDSPACPNSLMNRNQLLSQSTDLESQNSTPTSEFEYAETDNYQTTSRYNSYPEMQQYLDRAVMDGSFLNYCYPDDQQGLLATSFESDLDLVAQEDIAKVLNETGLGLTPYESRKFDLSRDEASENFLSDFQSTFLQPSVSMPAAIDEDHSKQETVAFSETLTDNIGLKKEDAGFAQGKSMFQKSFSSQIIDAECGSAFTSNNDVEGDMPTRVIDNDNPLLKRPSLDLADIEVEGLKKHDSFSRWMNQELGVVEDSQMKSSSGVYWSTADSGSVEVSSMPDPENLDPYVMSPSISEDQLFSIMDFSPNWTYTSLETKVLVTGRFLKDKEEVDKCKWSCMFGEVEVPAEILGDSSLRCHAPPHRSGKVPFYITCSNRLACSEVREFEYRGNDSQSVESTSELRLHWRLERLLSLESVGNPIPFTNDSKETLLCSKVSSLMLETDDDDWCFLLRISCNNDFSSHSVKDKLLEKLLKQKLHTWLLNKAVEDGKGPSVLDKEGQGVLHLAAALGYDWAIEPTTIAGVSINFRDVHGWTALHWAAYRGREHTVGALVAFGAAPGALTDPTPEFPSGRTPADLASRNGHKGIAGFLAESSLTSHLSTLTLKDSRGNDISGVDVVSGIDDVPAKSAFQVVDQDAQATVSLKDSLSAVRNAAQAAARIHQVFRVQSFQRKKLLEYGDGKCGISNEHNLSLLSVKTSRPGQHDFSVHTAAIRIQNKFRGWKGRKEFLVMRQRIVKIQAHIRGHQARKHYRKVVWTVGIVEKAILRWRRKGSGLRGFKSEGLLEGMPNQPPKDDYDFLKEGRKQTEVRLEKALARVKSMVQYPEARDQYRRLSKVVTELQESKVMQEKIQHGSKEATGGDFMMDLEDLWEDDVLSPTAS